jgi:zinc transporter 2
MHNLQEYNTESDELQDKKHLIGHTRSSSNVKPLVLSAEADGGYWYSQSLIHDV